MTKKEKKSGRKEKKRSEPKKSIAKQKSIVKERGPAALYNPAPPSVHFEAITSTDAKNHFGTVLDRVNRGIAFQVTRHEAPAAVILSMDQYAKLSREPVNDLGALEAEFEATYRNMQGPKAVTRMQDAFDMSPKELGRIALEYANQDD